MHRPRGRPGRQAARRRTLVGRRRARPRLQAALQADACPSTWCRPRFVVAGRAAAAPPTASSTGGRCRRRRRRDAAGERGRRRATPAEQLLAGIWAEVLGVADASASTTTSSTSAATRCSPPRWWPGCAASADRRRPAGQRDGPVPAPHRSASWPPLATGGAATRPAPAAARADPAGAGGAERVAHAGLRAVRRRQRRGLPAAGRRAAGRAPRCTSVAIPGHDIGLGRGPRCRSTSCAAGVAAEILRAVEGPLVLYGHCGVGGALAVEVARRLEAAGRELEAVYIGAMFPFARPAGGLLGRCRGCACRAAAQQPGLRELAQAHGRRHRRPRPGRRPTGSSATCATTPGPPRSTSPACCDQRVTAAARADRLGGRRPGPGHRLLQERYREWQFLTDTTALVVLDEAGHFFLKYRADELAEIVTTVHRGDSPAGDRRGQTAEAADPAPGRRPGGRAGTGRRLRSRPGTRHAGRPGRRPATAPEPSMRRFLAVAAGQLVSIIGLGADRRSPMPLWIYLETGSLARFALFAVLGLLPGLLVAPLAGALVDRTSRRRVHARRRRRRRRRPARCSPPCCWTDRLQLWHIYLLVALLSVALAVPAPRVRLGGAAAGAEALPRPRQRRHPDSPTGLPSSSCRWSRRACWPPSA